MGIGGKVKAVKSYKREGRVVAQVLTATTKADRKAARLERRKDRACCQGEAPGRSKLQA